MRPRITTSKLVRSTDSKTNGIIVKKSKRLKSRVEKHRAFGVFLKNAFDTPGRFIYMGM